MTGGPRLLGTGLMGVTFLGGREKNQALMCSLRVSRTFEEERLNIVLVLVAYKKAVCIIQDIEFSVACADW